MFKGTILSQLIGVLGSLYLAKMYATSLYGFYSVFLSLTSIITIICSLKLEDVIITEKSEESCSNLVNSLLITTLLISIISIISFCLFRSYLSEKGITSIIIVLSIITSLITANSRILESFSVRKSNFKTISKAKVITTFSTITLQLGLFYFIEDGLLYGFLGSSIIVFIFYLVITRNIISIPNLGLFKNSLKRNKNLLLFGFPSGLVNSLAINIMPILLLSFFSASSTGVFALSMKIVSIPLFIISSSISQVYFQKASEFYNYKKSELYKFSINVIKSNTIFIISILFLINTIGVFLLNLIYDNEWENLNLYILILSFYIVARTMFSPISSIIVVTNKMHVGLIFNFALFLINIVAIYVGFKYESIKFTVIILSLFGGVSYLILLSYFLKILKSYKNEK